MAGSSGGIQCGDGAPGVDQGLEQRVGGQPVGAVDAGAGGLPGGEQPRHGGAAGAVGQHAAHPVVLGLGDRHGAGGEVEAEVGQPGGDPGEAAGQETGPAGALDAGGVQVHGAGGRAGAVDGAGDHVARGQLRVRVHVRHEAVPGAVQQHRALPAHGLGHHERPLRNQGGVELDELGVGQHGAGLPSQGRAVAGGAGGVGGLRVQPADASGGQQHDVGAQFGVCACACGQGAGSGGAEEVPLPRPGPGPDGHHLALADGCVLPGSPAGAQQPHAGDPAGVVQQGGDERALADFQATLRLEPAAGGDQGAGEGAAGGVAAGVQDARVGVRGFQAQQVARPGGVGVERGAQRGQALHLRPGGGAKQPDGADVVQPGPGAQGVGDVLLPQSRRPRCPPGRRRPAPPWA